MTTTEQTAGIDLQGFTGANRRFAMWEPWVRGGWRYATDNAIIVRVPAPGEPDTPAAEKEFPPVPEQFASITGPFAPWPTDGIEPGVTTCYECGGGGTVGREQCTRCHGDGVYTCAHCDSEVECKKCDGTGWSDKGRDCPVCGGKGELDGKGRNVGAHLICLWYDAKIRGLPNVEYVVGVTGVAKPLPFRFTGGEGLIMGLRW